MRESGFTHPILLDGSKAIIAGHGWLLAANELVHETVPIGTSAELMSDFCFWVVLLSC
jgi:hypothetical protein